MVGHHLLIANHLAEPSYFLVSKFGLGKWMEKRFYPIANRFSSSQSKPKRAIIDFHIGDTRSLLSFYNFKSCGVD